jgi:glutaminyl-peptide cyclotransferase
MLRPVVLALAAIVACGCGGAASTVAPAPIIVPSLDYSIVNTYPHDPGAFTQGLLFHDGFLYESTGRNGSSSVRKVRLETGEVVQKRDVSDTYFAEGLALAGNRLVQLTWTTKIGFIYDLTTFEPRGTFDYEGEGWGLTRDGNRLVMSDGTSQLRFLDPDTLKVTGTLAVSDGGEPVRNLNELEVVGDALLANVWTTQRIVRIDLKTGAVTGHLDLDRLRPTVRAGQEIDVLNGIAYDAATKRLFVTGKLWPTLYELKVAGVN